MACDLVAKNTKRNKMKRNPLWDIQWLGKRNRNNHRLHIFLFKPIWHFVRSRVTLSSLSLLAAKGKCDLITLRIWLLGTCWLDCIQQTFMYHQLYSVCMWCILFAVGSLD
uniref:Uncharacterized protein n=1 Tax=Rhizophora mucronata TaxID=61149 RepID=A0A2P2PK06_RHIMU